MKQPLNIGDPHPSRIGYYFFGFRTRIKNWRSKQVVRPQQGKAFPLWLKLDHPPLRQLSLFDVR